MRPGAERKLRVTGNGAGETGLAPEAEPPAGLASEAEPSAGLASEPQRPGWLDGDSGEASGSAGPGWSARWRLGLEDAFGAAWLDAGRQARAAGQRLTAVGGDRALTSAACAGSTTASEGRSTPRTGQDGDADPEIGLELGLEQPGGPALRLHLALWPLPGAALERARAALAAAPDLAAALRDGRFPADLADRLADADAALLPGPRGDYLVDCACGQAPDCAHAAAALMAFGEALDEAPELLLTLRGSSPAELLGIGTAAQAPTAPALEDLLDGFWSAGRGLAGFRTAPRAPELPLALLRQLGPPGFVEGDLARILGPAYARISERALGLAFRAEATASPPPPRAPRAARRP